MILINKRENYIISENLQIADTFFKRLKGLMFEKVFPEENALKITPCNQIHTFFMNFPIDILYLDSNNTIVFIEENLKPGKIGKRVKNALAVIELPDGMVKKFNLQIGDLVLIRNKK